MAGSPSSARSTRSFSTRRSRTKVEMMIDEAIEVEMQFCQDVPFTYGVNGMSPHS